MSHDVAMGGPGADQLLARLPQDVRESLSAEQRAAIRHAVEERNWTGEHPVDLRLHIPLPVRPYYMVVVAGRERRARTRRENERMAHPLRTVGNMFFAGLMSALVIAIAFIGILLYSAVVEF